MSASKRVRSAMAADDGVALITVIGIMVLVTLLAVGAFQLANEALHEAKRAEGQTRAFRVASAGLDATLSIFSPKVNTYPDVVTPEGTATVSVVRNPEGDAGEYEIISTGTSIDGKTESVVQTFYWFNLWEMNFAGKESQSLMSGSSGMNGSSNIYGPFYVKGNLSLDAYFKVMDGPLFVNGGKLATTSAAAVIGTPSKKVRIYCDGDTDLVKGELHYTGPFVSVPEIQLPVLTQDDMRGGATLAQSESLDNKMSRQEPIVPLVTNLESTSNSGETYKFFGDTTSTIDPLGQGTTPLVLGTPTNQTNWKGEGTFGSWGAVETTGQIIPAGPVLVDGSALYDTMPENTWDDFAYWDNPTGVTPSGWDIMFISGTVFVDGPLVINDNVLYVGNGTIVANGPVTLRGRVRPYSYSESDVVVNKVGEDKAWALGIVTPSSIDMYASNANDGTYPVRDNAFDYAGAFYTDKVLTIHQPSTSVRGSILSNKMDLLGTNGDIVTNPLLPTYLPDSLPGGGEGILSPGIWSRG